MADAETRAPARRPRRGAARALTHLLIWVAAAAAVAGLYLDTLPAGRGTRAWWYILDLVSTQVGAMVVVAAAIGVSTVLFHTITANRILTPSVIGFDSLYLLIQTLLVWYLGAAGLQDHPLGGALGSYALSAGLMVAFAVWLYSWLLLKRRVALPTLLLAGLVFGLVFRSVGAMFQRLLDPAAFVQVQGAMFASFSYVDRRLLVVSAVITALGTGLALARRRRLDVMLLGRDPAIALGVAHHREVMMVLFLCAVLVSAATALVGPVLFFGLIVSNGAYQLLRTQRHAHTLPAAIGLGILALAGGQLALRATGVEGGLSIAIDFVGGMLFLFLLLKGRTT